jgi:hypothetical protein
LKDKEKQAERCDATITFGTTPAAREILTVGFPARRARFVNRYPRASIPFEWRRRACALTASSIWRNDTSLWQIAFVAFAMQQRYVPNEPDASSGTISSIVALALTLNSEPINIETIFFAAAVVATALIRQRMRVVRR